MESLSVEVDLTNSVESKSDPYAGYSPANERAKKIFEEIKVANEAYFKKLKTLNETKLAVQVLQAETFEALQKSAALNEQFYINVNRQLLHEQEKLKTELKEVNMRLDDYIKKFKAINK